MNVITAQNKYTNKPNMYDELTSVASTDMICIPPEREKVSALSHTGLLDTQLVVHVLVDTYVALLI